MGFFSNLFNRKKKEEQQPTQNMSYARQSNPYMSSNLFSSASRPSATPKPTPQPSRGFDLSAPKTAASSAQVRKPSSSSGSGYQRVIAGSGYGSNYAINSGMSPQEIARRNKQVTDATARNRAARAPKTTIDAPPGSNTQPGGSGGMTMSQLFSNQAATNRAARDRNVSAAEARNKAYVDQITGSYNRANESLINQIPFLQQQSDASKEELLAAAEDIRKSGLVQKDATEEYYGDALRQGAQTGREQEKKLKNMFAALGTLDSSQFRDAMINTTEETTRGQQQTVRAKARELASIEATVQEAERKAQLTVQQEVAKFNETIRKINETVYNNEAAKEEDIRAAYADLQGVVAEIENTLDANNMALQNARFEFQQEQLKLDQAKPGYGMSEQFMNTGVPSTPEEEYILRQGETAAQNIINGFMDIDSITDPNIRAIAQDIVAQSGATAGGGKSGGGTVAAKDLNIAVTGIEDVAKLRQMFADNPSQAKTTKIPFAGQSYDTLIENVTDKIGRLRSGGAINSDEEARFKRLLPTFWDTPNTVQFKLNQLEQEFQGLAGMGMA